MRAPVAHHGQLRQCHQCAVARSAACRSYPRPHGQVVYSAPSPIPPFHLLFRSYLESQMGAMRRKAAVCQKPKGKTPGFKPVSCEIVIASNFKDWQVLLLRFVRIFLLVGHPLWFLCDVFRFSDRCHRCNSRAEDEQWRHVAPGLEETYSA